MFACLIFCGLESYWNQTCSSDPLKCLLMKNGLQPSIDSKNKPPTGHAFIIKEPLLVFIAAGCLQCCRITKAICFYKQITITQLYLIVEITIILLPVNWIFLSTAAIHCLQDFPCMFLLISVPVFECHEQKLQTHQEAPHGPFFLGFRLLI